MIFSLICRLTLDIDLIRIIGVWLCYRSRAAVIDFAFNSSRLERLQIRCFADNIASVKVAQKLGFSQEGLIRKG